MFTLKSGPYEVCVHEPLELDPEISHLGCSIVGKDDLFDLGFTVTGLDTHGLIVMDTHMAKVLVIIKPKAKDVKARSEVEARPAADPASR